MARRRRPDAIDLSFTLEAFLRLAGSIVIDTLAFSIWNIGTRSPAAVLRDVRQHAREPRSLGPGIVRLFIGAIFIAAGVVLVLPAVANPPADFAPIELFVFLVALALEHVVGADIRTVMGR